MGDDESQINYYVNQRLVELQTIEDAYISKKCRS